jgi:predicted DNA-binding transcriptional regulator AlpA
MKVGTSNKSKAHQGMAPVAEPLLTKTFVRANQIARSSRRQSPLIDISIATWWRWVASGRAPQPKRLSPGTTVWDLSEVLAFIKGR